MNRTLDGHQDPAGRLRLTADPVLADLVAAPYQLVRPATQRIPFIFASPHSGRLYPRAFLSQSRLTGANLRRSEDAYVEQLFASVVSLGAPLIAARFPRAYVDANRAPNELDPTMFIGPLALPADPTSARVCAGLGVIPKLVRDGAEIYRHRLESRDAEERLSRLHKPYQDTLQQLVLEARTKFNSAVLVDCHSMPSAAAACDIVLGDRYGTAASHAVMRAAEAAFQRHGFSVARNVPYAGGYTTFKFGQPRRGVHALQIEISRALYLDEEQIAPTAGFTKLAARLHSALAELTAVDTNLLCPQAPRAFAAE